MPDQGKLESRRCDSAFPVLPARGLPSYRPARPRPPAHGRLLPDPVVGPSGPIPARLPFPGLPDGRQDVGALQSGIDVREVQRGLSCQNRVVLLTCGVEEAGRDVVRLEIGVIREDLLRCLSGGQELKHVLHAEPHPPNARAAAALLGVDGDTPQQFCLTHGLPQWLNLKMRPARGNVENRLR